MMVTVRHASAQTHKVSGPQTTDTCFIIPGERPHCKCGDEAGSIILFGWKSERLFLSQDGGGRRERGGLAEEPLANRAAPGSSRLTALWGRCTEGGGQGGRRWVGRCTWACWWGAGYMGSGAGRSQEGRQKEAVSQYSVPGCLDDGSSHSQLGSVALRNGSQSSAERRE